MKLFSAHMSEIGAIKSLSMKKLQDVFIAMPKAAVRLSAGRRELGEAVQALCFIAGANSIFYGDRLLTTGNPDVEADRALLSRLGLSSA